jgi:Zn-dependent protease
MSLNIGRFFGINLNIHWTFWLLPLWVILSGPGSGDPEAIPLGMRLGLLAALFGCVVLHEYGHALMARLFGIATHDVTLYPIGGVARLERMSDRPWEEFCIAVAGPLVNVAIALGLGFVVLTAALLQPDFLHTVVAGFLVPLLVMNIFLVVFNLLPAFPMDGGRVLRAILAAAMGRLRATRVAVIVGTVMAVLFGITGVWLWHNPWLLLIGLFVIWAGHQELYQLQQRELHGDEVEPESAAPGWHGSGGATVTVYIWDARKHVWVPQGVIPAHGFSDREPF